MFCDIKGAKIYYEIVGVGRQVLMLHGFALDHQMMKGCMEPIFEKRPGWKRIYFDLPGMGKSETADWIKGSDDMVDAISGFIDQVIGEENFLVAGESYGGIMARAIIYKRADNVDGMFIFCPAIKLGVTPDDLPTRNIQIIDEEFVNSLEKDKREFMQSFAVIQNEYTWQRIEKEVYSGFLARDQEFIEKVTQGGSYSLTYDVDDLKKPFDKPALILAGRQDHWVGYKGAWDFYDNYPRGTFAVLDVAGHGLQYEQVSLFNQLTNEWLDRVEDYLEEG